MNSIRLKTMQAVNAAALNIFLEGSALIKAEAELLFLKKIRVCHISGSLMTSAIRPVAHTRDNAKVIAQAYLTRLFAPICRTRG